MDYYTSGYQEFFQGKYNAVFSDITMGKICMPEGN
jgi:hypothetical protein